MDKCSILFCCNGNDADKKVYGIWVGLAATILPEGTLLNLQTLDLTESTNHGQMLYLILP